MYPSGRMDPTWMSTMTNPYPSTYAPGRWDITSMVGYAQPNYGPQVPWTYYTPFLHGSGLGEESDPFGPGLTLVALGIGVMVGYFIGVSGRYSTIDMTNKESRR